MGWGYPGSPAGGGGCSSGLAGNLTLRPRAVTVTRLISSPPQHTRQNFSEKISPFNSRAFSHPQATPLGDLYSTVLHDLPPKFAPKLYETDFRKPARPDAEPVSRGRGELGPPGGLVGGWGQVDRRVSATGEPREWQGSWRKPRSSDECPCKANYFLDASKDILTAFQSEDEKQRTEHTHRGPEFYSPHQPPLPPTPHHPHIIPPLPSPHQVHALSRRKPMCPQPLEAHRHRPVSRIRGSIAISISMLRASQPPMVITEGSGDPVTRKMAARNLAMGRVEARGRRVGLLAISPGAARAPRTLCPNRSEQPL